MNGEDKRRCMEAKTDVKWFFEGISGDITIKNLSNTLIYLILIDPAQVA